MEVYQLANILNAIDEQEWLFKEDAEFSTLMRGDKTYRYQPKTGYLYQSNLTSPIMSAKEEGSIASFLSQFELNIDNTHVKLATWYSNELDERIQLESDAEQRLTCGSQPAPSKFSMGLPFAVLGFLVGCLL